MLVGINWTYPQTYSVIRQLKEEGLIDFCEISLDNFIHLSPEAILNVLQDIPVSFHILSSRFLEKAPQELQDMAKSISYWVKVIKPLYVSDHLAQFTYQNKQLPLPLELNYQYHQNHIIHRVIQWQALLDCQIFFENFPSLPDIEIKAAGDLQPQFFEDLIKQTGAGLLFDFSNAYIADINGVCDFNQWYPLIQKAAHFHVGGFRMMGSPAFAVDTHDVPISDSVLQMMRKTELISNKQTLVIEFDKNISFDTWKRDIMNIRDLRGTLV